jgi:hypothetical protein
LRPAQASKTPSENKRAGGVAQGVGAKFKPEYWGKKKIVLWKTHNTVYLI